MSSNCEGMYAVKGLSDSFGMWLCLSPQYRMKPLGCRPTFPKEHLGAFAPSLSQIPSDDQMIEALRNAMKIMVCCPDRVHFKSIHSIKVT